MWDPANVDVMNVMTRLLQMTRHTLVYATVLSQPITHTQTHKHTHTHIPEMNVQAHRARMTGLVQMG